jgi:ABC-type antimicrobial peptide transport system permease subunit
VARRTSEIGVRMALGAPARQVLWMVLRESSSFALFGIAIGLAAGICLIRFVRNMLYGLQPTDPAAFIRAALPLLAIAIAASYGPAHRASRIDPMQALRHE